MDANSGAGGPAGEIARTRADAGSFGSGSDAAWLARGSGLTIFGSFFGRALRISLQIVIARCYGPVVFGLYAIDWTIVRICGVFAPLGLNNGALHYVATYAKAEPSRIRDVLCDSLELSLCSAISLGVLMWFAAPVLAVGLFGKPILAPTIRLLALNLPLVAALSVLSAATRASQSMLYTVIAELIAVPAVNLALVIVLYAAGFGLRGLIVAILVSYLVGVALSGYYVRGLFPVALLSNVERQPLRRELLAFSVPASVAGALTLLVFWIDRLMVGIMLPAAEVGVYNAASQLSVSFDVILAAFNVVFASRVSRLYASSQRERLDALFKVSTKWAVYVCLPMFLVVCLWPRDVMMVLYGIQYSPGGTALLILAVGQMVNAATGPVGYIMIFTGHQRRLACAAASAVGLAVLLNMALIPRFGLTGAAVSTAMCNALLFPAVLLMVRRLVGIWPFDRRWLKGLGAAAGAAGFLAAVGWLSIESVPAKLLLAFMGSGATFVGALWLLGLDAEDREIVEVMRARTHRL